MTGERNKELLIEMD